MPSLMPDDDEIAKPRAELGLLLVLRQAANVLHDIGAKIINADGVLVLVLRFALKPFSYREGEIAVAEALIFLGKRRAAGGTDRGRRGKIDKALLLGVLA